MQYWSGHLDQGLLWLLHAAYCIWGWRSEPFKRNRTHDTSIFILLQDCNPCDHWRDIWLNKTSFLLTLITFLYCTFLLLRTHTWTQLLEILQPAIPTLSIFFRARITRRHGGRQGAAGFSGSFLGHVVRGDVFFDRENLKIILSHKKIMVLWGFHFCASEQTKLLVLFGCCNWSETIIEPTC